MAELGLTVLVLRYCNGHLFIATMFFLLFYVVPLKEPYYKLTSTLCQAGQ